MDPSDLEQTALFNNIPEACPACQGKGHFSADGSPQWDEGRLCRHCSGSGRRQQTVDPPTAICGLCLGTNYLAADGVSCQPGPWAHPCPLCREPELDQGRPLSPPSPRLNVFSGDL